MTSILFSVFSGVGIICLIVKLFLSEFLLDEVLFNSDEDAMDKTTDFDDDDDDFELKLGKYCIYRKAFSALAWFFLVSSVVIFVLGKAMGVM